MLPRIPLVKDFEASINDPKQFYHIKEMKLAKQGRVVDKTTILYNNNLTLNLTLSGIPLEAYDYVVNGKPALEWIIERYAITQDKDSGITNDANLWSDDSRYIVDLLKRIVTVSNETVKIVKNLPSLA